MTGTNLYVTSAELKATLTMTSESFADADIDLAVSAASRSIDDLCNRRFWLDADAAQVRYYTPEAENYVKIDDLTTFTSLATDPGGDGTYESVWTLNTDFVLEPLNAPADNWPYTALRVHPAGSFLFDGPWRFRGSMPRSVKLTGKFGFPNLPDEIKTAAGVLASRYLKRTREAPFGIAGFGMDGGVVSIARFDPDVAALVKHYIRTRIAVA